MNNQSKKFDIPIMKKELSIEVTLQILKPADEVFEAIADPAKMTKYFISESSGRIEEGKTVSWKFPEFSIVFPVRGGKSVKPEYISFYWENQGRELLVEFTLKPNGPDRKSVV